MMLPPDASTVLRYLVAFVIGSHGVAYLMYASQSGKVLEGWTRRALVFGTTFSGDRLEAVATALWVVAGIGLVCTAVAFGLWFPMLDYWRPIAVGASLVSIASFAVVWDGRAEGFAPEGGIGMMISAIILVGSVGLS
jgi:hypothetical protein